MSIHGRYGRVGVLRRTAPAMFLLLTAAALGACAQLWPSRSVSVRVENRLAMSVLLVDFVGQQAWTVPPQSKVQLVANVTSDSESYTVRDLPPGCSVLGERFIDDIDGSLDVVVSESGSVAMSTGDTRSSEPTPAAIATSTTDCLATAAPTH